VGFSENDAIFFLSLSVDKAKWLSTLSLSWQRKPNVWYQAHLLDSSSLVGILLHFLPLSSINLGFQGLYIARKKPDPNYEYKGRPDVK
jgi:hypothetical protein